jgi:20S proteasome alpha/beta subunit
MTVVVGFVGTDGAVMASDSQESEDDETRHEVEKIWEDGGLLFGYSGHDAVKLPLQIAVSAALETAKERPPDRWAARRLLTEAAKPVLLEAYGTFVPTSQRETARKLGGALLVLGRDEPGYWLLEINHNNVATFYTARGFHAIGTGSVAAQVATGLLEAYEPADRSVGHLRLMAYRSVETCIRVLGGGWGVGGHPHVWHSEKGGSFHKATSSELAALANDVGSWILVERESLDQAFPETSGSVVDDAVEDLPIRAQE